MMAPEDEDNTAFVIKKYIDCYKLIPFRLKNVRAIYQRLVNKIFKDQINRTKRFISMTYSSKTSKTTSKDLEETFNALHSH